MKGVILAGGSGSRLHPLTRITNKHLLPIFDRPMVTYAIEALVRAGVTEMMVVTGGTHAGEFLRLLGNGHAYAAREILDRIDKAHALVFHQKTDGSAMRPATEAVIELLGLADRE